MAKITKIILKWAVLGIGIVTALLAGIYGKEIGSEISKYINITKTKTAIPSHKEIMDSFNKDKQTESPHPICKLSRQEMLSDALSKGVTDINELKKLAATYDLLCFGETDIEIPESPQVVKTDKQPVIKVSTPTPMDTSFTDKWEQERKEECQEDISEYNTCMNEYNVEMAEYSACLSECNTPNSITGEIPQFCHCVKPYNSCSKPYCAGL